MPEIFTTRDLTSSTRGQGETWSVAMKPSCTYNTEIDSRSQRHTHRQSAIIYNADGAQNIIHELFVDILIRPCGVAHCVVCCIVSGGTGTFDRHLG